jgi:hypothetical protein
MDKSRVITEIQVITDAFTTVMYDLNDRFIEVEDIPLPDGWNRQTATARIILPEIYPQEPPTVLVPADLRYHGDIPRWMYPRINAPDGWTVYDVGLSSRRFGTRSTLRNWTPYRDSTVTVLRLLQASLDDPGGAAPTPEL